MVNFDRYYDPPDYSHLEICDVCGKHADVCICPECPVCGEIGALRCYAAGLTGHGLIRTTVQVESLHQAEMQAAAHNAAEDAYWRSLAIDE